MGKSEKTKEQLIKELESVKRERDDLKSLLNQRMTHSEDEALLHLLAHSPLTGIFIHKDFEILFINDRMVELLGYDKSEKNSFVGQNLYAHIHPDYRPMVEEFATKRLRGDLPKSSQYEIQLIKKDGSPQWAEVLISVIEYKDSTAFMGHVIDISSHKNAEQALEEGGEMLRLALDSVGESMWAWNVVANEVVIDERGLISFGGIEDQAKQKMMDWLKRVHPDDLESLKNAQKEYIEKSKGLFRAEYRFQSESGEWRWALAEGKTIHWDKNGRSIKVIGVIRDITKKKEDEQKLLLAQHSVDNVTPGIFWFARSGKIFYVNNAACKALEYTQEELIGKTISFIDTNFTDDNTSDLAQSLNNKPSVIIESEHITKSGRKYPVEIIANHLKFEKQEYYIAIVQDISDRKKIEEKTNRALQETQLRANVTSGLLEGASAMLEDVDFESTSHTIFNSCRKLIQAKAGFLALFSEESGLAEIQFSHPSFGGSPAFTIDLSAKKYQELCKDKTLLINRFEGSKLSKYISTSKELYINNMLAAPLHVDGHIAGMLVLANKVEDFDNQDIIILRAYSELSATAYRNAQTRNALQESRDLFQKVINTIPACVTVKDRNGKFILANNATAKIYGPTVEDMLGRTELDYIGLIGASEADIDEYLKTDRMVIDSKESLFIPEEPLTTDDGGIRYFQTIKTPIAVREDPNCVLVVSIEITERKMTEELLQDSEDKFRTIGASALDAIIMINGYGNIEYWNPAAEELFGYTSAEAIGKNAHSLLAPKRYSHRIQKQFEIFQQTGTGPAVGKTIELTSKRKDGSTFPIELSLTAIPKYNEYWSLATIRDITDRKNAEAERERLEEQLRHSQKMDAIGRLAGGVAHDFNNILTAIQGFSDIIITSLDKRDPIYSDMQEIYRAAETASSLTQQLLAFSRKQVIIPRATNLNKAVSKSERLLRRIIGEDIDVEIIQEKTPWHIRIDPAQIDQILVNLAVNSRDAMSDGGKIIIKIENVFVEDKPCKVCTDIMDGEYVLLKVTDSGQGMDEEMLRQIFEPFFTTKDGTTKGTGLGLATVHGIVHQNNGHVDVISTPGVGSEFSIYFPRIEDPVVEEKIESMEKQLTGQETILLTEDQTQVRKLASRFLKEFGYKVIEAEDGYSALNICKEYDEKIDMLLTDVVMPKMNGKELYERVKEFFPNIDVLYMSGYTENEIGHHGILDIGTNFISKPFNQKELLQKVRSIIKRSIRGDSRMQEPQSELMKSDTPTALIVDDEEVVCETIKAILRTKGHSFYSAIDPIEGLEVFKQHKDEIDYLVVDQTMPNMLGHDFIQEVRKLNPDLPALLLSGFSDVNTEIEGLGLTNATAFLSKPFRKNDLLGALKKIIDFD